MSDVAAAPARLLNRIANGSAPKHRIIATISFVASVISTIVYSIAPPEGPAHSIWHWNKLYPTAFSLNPIITSIFISLLMIRQTAYIVGLWLDNSHHDVSNRLNPYFAANSLLHVAWIVSFSHRHFILALIFLIFNHFNLAATYVAHLKTGSLWMQWGIASGPLAFNIVALLWTGALAVPWGSSTVLRILGNVAIWILMLVGLMFLGTYHDYSMGFSLATLTWALAMAQFFTKVVALQWIFAFTIMGVLTVASFAVAIPLWTGRQVAWWRVAVESEDSERRPLINEGQQV